MVNINITNQALAYIKERGNSIIIRSVPIGGSCCVRFDNPTVLVEEPPEHAKYEKFIQDGITINISQSLVRKCTNSLTISLEGFLFLKELKVSGFSLL